MKSFPFEKDIITSRVVFITATLSYLVPKSRPPARNTIQQEMTLSTTTAQNEDEYNVATEPYVDEPWTIIDSYFRNQHLDRVVRHQLESYNYFVACQLPKTIEMFNPVLIRSDNDFDPISRKYGLEIQMSFENFRLQSPQIHENNGAIKRMFPNEARLRNYSYSATMLVDIHLQYIVRSKHLLETTQTYYKTLPAIQIGKLPVMVRSDICLLRQFDHLSPDELGECRNDAGGYFIINGCEKTVLGQERAAENKVYLFNIAKTSTKYTWTAEIKSVPDYKCISPKQITMYLSAKNEGFGQAISIQIPRTKQKTPIPLFVVFRALGVLSDKDICELILVDLDTARRDIVLPFLQASILESNHCMTQESALQCMMNHVNYSVRSDMNKSVGKALKTKFTLDVLNTDLFPHCHTVKQKVYFLGYMASRLLHAHFEWASADDRDSYLNKRIDLTGTSLNNLTRNFINKMVKDSMKKGVKEIDTGNWRSTDDVTNIINLTNIYKIIKVSTIEGGYRRALSTGDFGIKQVNSNKVGVAQVLNRLNGYATLSHSNRISAPQDKSGKLVPPRKLHPTSWGFICPAETPEGQTVGVVKNRSYMCHITIPSDNTALHEIVRRHIDMLDAEGDPVTVFEAFGHFVQFPTSQEIETERALALRDEANANANADAGNTDVTTAETDETKEMDMDETSDGSDSTESTYRPPTQSIWITDEITSMLRLQEGAKVFLNGAWIGMTRDPIALVERLREMKHSGILHPYVSIFFDTRLKEVRVCNDAGRVTRPLLRVKTALNEKTGRIASRSLYLTHSILKRLQMGELQFDDLLTNQRIPNAVIEYVDAEEQSVAMISPNPKTLATADADKLSPLTRYTHCEIHCHTIFGIVASCIPYSDHNQSPRNTYQCAQAKQAMGVYATNYDKRMDKTAYNMIYPTRPLIDTRIMEIMKLDRMPAGANITVAIMTYTGYNQEDSLLVNKGAIERGLLNIDILHTEKDEEKQKVKCNDEMRCKPDASKTKGMKFANYNKVNAKGLIPENTLVENRDVIIAKVQPIKENKNDPTVDIKYEDRSKIYKVFGTDQVYVDKNYVDKNGDGYNFAKVRLRALRRPVIGDKFSSRHGQKGTVGNLVPEEEMPYNANGDRPDIILNPHAIPSRMTMGQLIESQLGKVLVHFGLFGDGTSFGNLTVEDVSQMLIEIGKEAHGNELLYDGKTGRMLECSVFMGVVFYQRLKHMVADKQHCRSIGPMVNLTRQPAEGRSRDGGHRFGEMERDCMLSHGAMRFTKGRMFDESDKYAVHVCNKCGMIAPYNDRAHVHVCKTCSNSNRAKFSYVEIPYACKLFFHELITMNVVPRMITTNTLLDAKTKALSVAIGGATTGDDTVASRMESARGRLEKLRASAGEEDNKEDNEIDGEDEHGDGDSDGDGDDRDDEEVHTSEDEEDVVEEKMCV